MALKNGIKHFLKTSYNHFYKASRLQKLFYILAILFIMTLFVKHRDMEGFEERSTEFKLKEGQFLVCSYIYT